MGPLGIYFRIVRRYWGWFALTIASVMVLACVGIVPPYLLGRIVDALSSTERDFDRISELLVWLAVSFLATLILYRIFDLGIINFECRGIRDVGKMSMEAYQRKSVRFYEDSKTGSLVSQEKRFRNAFERLSDLIFFNFGKCSLRLLVVLMAFLWFVPWLGLGLFLWAILYVVVSYWLARWKYPLDLAAAEADSAVGGGLSDTLSNRLAVVAYSQEKAEQKRFDGLLETWKGRVVKAWWRSSWANLIQGAVMSVFEVALIYCVLLGWKNGIYSVGDVVFVQTSLIWLFMELWMLGEAIRHWMSSLADAQEMAEVIDSEPEVKDSPGARPIVVKRGAIKFHAVRFSYPARDAVDRPIIDNINLDIAPGQKVALVGSSGAGKTTLVAKLLPRFYDLDSGYIEIDGTDISTVTQISLRRNFALVLQQSLIFNRTVRENIAFSRPDASDDEVIEAAKRAQIWDFIYTLPSRLDEEVGEDGVKLSVGQAQRLAFARAFLLDAPIVVMDEPTSSIDSGTEERILRSIAKDLIKGKTTLIIAHRLSTVRNADRILVIDEGRVVQDGTHENLFEQSGIYQSLWHKQQVGYVTG